MFAIQHPLALDSSWPTTPRLLRTVRRASTRLRQLACGLRGHDRMLHFEPGRAKGRRPAVAEMNVDVATGKPALQILRMAQARNVDLIVMSTHGLTGARKFFLGSTTERVLRETSIPRPSCQRRRVSFQPRRPTLSSGMLMGSTPR